MTSCPATCLQQMLRNPKSARLAAGCEHVATGGQEGVVGQDELPAAGMAGLREAVLDYYEGLLPVPVAQPSARLLRCRGDRGRACNAGSSAGPASPPTSFLRSPLCSMPSKMTAEWQRPPHAGSLLHGGRDVA
jgi:hypothetical protein